MTEQPTLFATQTSRDGSCGTRPTSTAQAPAANAKSLVIHPFLLAVYPILHLFAANAVEVPSVELLGLITFASVATVVVWVFLSLVFKNSLKGALLTSLAILLFWTFGFAYQIAEFTAEQISFLWIKYQYHVSPWALLVLELGLFAGIARVLTVNPKFLRSVTSVLNVFTLFLLVVPVSVSLAVKAPTVARPPRQPVPFAIPKPAESSARPDIYYIILDGYARSDVMKRLFQFDNSGFIERLERKGFSIAHTSTANYCQTPLSLSSSLNAVYLDDLVKPLDRDQTELSNLIGNSNVLATLRPLGYKFVTFDTGFDPTEHPEADLYLSPRPHFSGFQRMVIDPTPLAHLWPRAGQFNKYELARERINFLFDRLPDVARDPAPTFTFAHLLCPHPPFVFDQNGESTGVHYINYDLTNGKKVNGRFPRPEHFSQGYRDQSAYVTTRIEKTIEQILANSPRPPIILLQSDHGSELNLDPYDIQNTDLNERMSILNAYYFPGGRYEGLYDSISPVNSFRVVLNSFFGAKIELLPDRSFYSTWPEPYDFIDVTSAVRPTPVVTR